jgi:hypothetical protein
MEKFCVLGAVAGSLHTRYAVLKRGIVVSLQVSRPDGEEVPVPAVLKYTPAPAVPEVRISLPAWNERGPLNGQQPRRTTWKRAGRRAEGGV